MRGPPYRAGTAPPLTTLTLCSAHEATPFYVRITVPVRSNFARPLGVAEESGATVLNGVAGRGLRQGAQIGVDGLQVGVGHAVIGGPGHRLQHPRVKALTGAESLGCRTNRIDHAAVFGRVGSIWIARDILALPHDLDELRLGQAARLAAIVWRQIA